MSNPTDTNQASEDKPINQHLVCLWQLHDIEETIADAAPEELADLHSKLVALSTNITEDVQAAIRTEKLKLLAEVRERVVGENQHSEHKEWDCPCGATHSFTEEWHATNHLRDEQRAALTKLEAEL